MVRGRTTAPANLILGHEITGEVVEAGPGVEFIKVGDLCSVPFNIACGRCRMCKEGKTGICLNCNPERPAPRTATWTWAAGWAARPST
jgi:glutathione-independent formaldehyde dehydrogenase